MLIPMVTKLAHSLGAGSHLLSTGWVTSILKLSLFYILWM